MWQSAEVTTPLKWARNRLHQIVDTHQPVAISEDQAENIQNWIHQIPAQ